MIVALTLPPLMMTLLLIVGSGKARALASLPLTITCGVAPGLLKLIVSWSPKVPGFSAMLCGPAGSWRALVGAIAWRIETLPSLGVMSSAVVVTVIGASRFRRSSGSRHGR